MTPMNTKDFDWERLVVIPAARQHGRLTQQMIEFYAACKKGEKVVFRMLEGDICSPEYAKVVINEAIKADRQQLLKAVEEYLEHKNDCIRSWYEAGRPIGNVGYEEKFRGKWYQSRPIDKTPKCDCGLDELLNEKGESHEN